MMLNDGGTTNFDHYGLKIKPENNKTLIWPAEWNMLILGQY